MNGTDGMNGADGQQGPQGSPGTPAPIESVVVPSYGPESVIADSAGNLFIASVGDGSVIKLGVDRRTITTFIPAATAQPRGKTGMFIDEAANKFYACAVGTDFMTPSVVRRYALDTGAFETELAMATGHQLGFCNDFARDAAGNLYVTDSFIGIQKLPVNGTALESWSIDALYQPVVMGSFGVDGIAVDGANVYVNNIESGALLRVPINPDGSAGAPVTITLTNFMGASVSLSGPDGMRLRSANTLLFAESGAAFGPMGTEGLTQVVVNPATNTGVRTVLSSRLDRPSAVAIAADGAWVTEGQIARVFGIDADGTGPTVPFLVRRVPLF